VATIKSITAVRPADPVFRRLRVLWRLQDRLQRRGGDSSAIDEAVRRAEHAVKRVRREMWRPIWGLFALPESGTRT